PADSAARGDQRADDAETNHRRNLQMKRIPISAVAVAALSLSMLGAGSSTNDSSDRYAQKVPGGLAFSEFKGYERWQAISVSRSDQVMAVILGNPAMINAYESGIPGNGKPFPDGAKMAKIHWSQKTSEYPGNPSVPATLHDIDFMVKDSKRFADS